MKNKEKKTCVSLPKPHEFVQTLEKHRSKCKLINGFIGTSKSDRHLRVYLDVELKRFVDVPTKDVLHFEDFRSQHSSTSSVVLWVNEKAKIAHFGNWFASEDPTTMATGEEGGGDPTTMATGEESSGPINPLDELVNPFGKFV